MAKKKKRHTYTGILSKHRKGFGFVACDDIEDDVFIAAGSMHGAMNGDEVEIDLIGIFVERFPGGDHHEGASSQYDGSSGDI